MDGYFWVKAPKKLQLRMDTCLKIMLFIDLFTNWRRRPFKQFDGLSLCRQARVRVKGNIRADSLVSAMREQEINFVEGQPSLNDLKRNEMKNENEEASFSYPLFCTTGRVCRQASKVNIKLTIFTMTSVLLKHFQEHHLPRYKADLTLFFCLFVNLFYFDFAYSQKRTLLSATHVIVLCVSAS